jgi:hypothetical protein
MHCRRIMKPATSKQRPAASSGVGMTHALPLAMDLDEKTLAGPHDPMYPTTSHGRSIQTASASNQTEE